ncbi:ras guanine nucleotide exchange factor domain-containing protein [Gorgonomyces haynaldii]|nr:ras guanine nucleotide exchange factor domain-containing protein [Gorgonomyces haynaldii]
MRLPSGWWDGILNGQRGWFPSNYVSTPQIQQPAQVTEPTEEQALPNHWGKKKTDDGRVYYYNVVTDETRWNLDEPVEKRPIRPRPEPAIEHRLEYTWEGFSKFIISRINHLQWVTNQNLKDKYVSCSSDVVEAIRLMLIATGTVSAESPVFTSHHILKMYHHQILGSLSRMVLSAKTASGLWPPPDAGSVLEQTISEVLLSTRNFIRVSDSQHLKIVMQHQKPENDSHSEATVGHAREVLNELTVTMTSIDRLIGSLDFSPKVDGDNIITKSIITTVRGIVSEVGDFLCLVDELPMLTPIESLDVDFKMNRLSLYNSISGLVMATRNATAKIPPRDAVEQLSKSTEQIEKSVKALFVCAKLYAAEEEEREQQTLHEYIESNTPDGKAPRRVLSMNFAEQGITAELQKKLSVADDVPHSAGATPMEDFVYRKPERRGDPTTFQRRPSIQTQERRISGDKPRLHMVYQKRPSITTSSSLSPISATFMHSPGVESFLGSDYTPDEIIFTADGQVKGATMRGLVEKLTMHDGVDPNFTTQFLITYRSFSNSSDLFDLLKQRFMIPPPGGLTIEELLIWEEKKQKPVRLRTFNVFKLWIENYIQQEDLPIIEAVRDFTAGPMAEQMEKVAQHLLRVIDRRLEAGLNGSINRMVVTSNKDVPQPIVPRSFPKKIKLLDLDPLEVARQITLMESGLFQKLQAPEFLDKAWSTTDQHTVAPNVKMMISRSNQITGWVAHTILSETDVKRRSKILLYFITVAEKCRELNNYNTLMTILAAFNSSPIHRLKKTWDLVPQKIMSGLDNLKDLMNSIKNFNSYRNALRHSNPPCVPFLGCYLTDLTFLEDANPHRLKEDPKMINFAKMAKIAEVIREVQQFQQASYQLKTVAEIESWLLKELYISPDESVLYDTSLQLEPRDGTILKGRPLNPEEDLRRILEGSGFV